MPKLNTNRFDHEYKIGKVLGEGGFGRVYSAVRLRDNFPVAVKQVSRHKIPSLVTVSLHSKENPLLKALFYGVNKILFPFCKKIFTF